MSEIDTTSSCNGEREERLELGRLGDLAGFLLRRIQSHLGRDFAAATAGQGLRSGMMSSLGLIRANPGLSQAALSKALMLDKSATVLIVHELERRGFARREKADGDRRRHSLFITDAGSAFLDQLLDTLSETENRLLCCLTAEEHRVFNRVLDKLYQACLATE
jgi:DNA-binding MarR family transcriptional regulator